MGSPNNKYIQVKFTVDEKQNERLEALAGQRDLSIPQFAKLTALGVRMTPAPVVEVKKEFEEEKELLNEILGYFRNDDGKESIFISGEFDSEMMNKIKKYMSK